MAVSSQLRRYRNYVDGRFEDADGGGTIAVENPATGAVVSEVPDSSRAATQRALARAPRVPAPCRAAPRASIASAERAQAGWQKLPPIERAGHLRRIAAALRKDP